MSTISGICRKLEACMVSSHLAPQLKESCENHTQHKDIHNYKSKCISMAALNHRRHTFCCCHRFTRKSALQLQQLRFYAATVLPEVRSIGTHCTCCQKPVCTCHPFSML